MGQLRWEADKIWRLGPGQNGQRSRENQKDDSVL